MNGEVLFKTIHGSRLYGFSNSPTDRDVYVVTNRGARGIQQVITDTEDRTEVGVDHFLELAAKGNVAALEAIMSPRKMYTSLGEGFRDEFEDFRLTSQDALDSLERVIRGLANGAFTNRRHAARLSLAFRAMRETGRFNPFLSLVDALWCTQIAKTRSGSELTRAVGLGYRLGESFRERRSLYV